MGRTYRVDQTAQEPPALRSFRQAAMAARSSSVMFDVEWETASTKGPDAGVHEFAPLLPARPVRLAATLRPPMSEGSAPYDASQ
jgi:hypothetical protein